MFAALIALLVSVVAAVGLYVNSQFGLVAAGLTAGGMTTLITLFMVWRAIRTLKNALLMAIAAREVDRKLHLMVLQRVKTNLERSKTVAHRSKLVDGLQKYIRDFQSEVAGGHAVAKLAHDTAND